MKKSVPLETFEEFTPMEFLVSMFQDFLRASNLFDEDQITAVTILGDDEMVVLKPRSEEQTREKDLPVEKELYSEEGDNE
jgi:hypothetical protein